MVFSDSGSTTTRSVDAKIESSLSIPQTIHYPRNSKDAVAVLNILKEWLPSELGLSILHHAEYWILSRVYREETLAYTSSDCRDKTPYLRSEPIQGDRFLVQKISIDIWSHDQEFNYYFESGTDNYDDAPTWFNFGIERPAGREDIFSKQDLHMVDNLRGRAKTTHHCIVYRRDEDVPWIQELQVGDRVSIIPQARFLGWKNFVERASIEVYMDPF